MRLRIYFENLQEKEAVGFSLKRLIRKAIKAALKYEEMSGGFEVSVTFCDNEKIQEMNKQFRNIDRATDVLSFPLFDEDGMDAHLEGKSCMLGDIVLSLEKARAQAEEFGHCFEREVAFLTVHSVLHLLGYDHETGEEDETDMRRRQSEIVDKLGLAVK